LPLNLITSHALLMLRRDNYGIDECRLTVGVRHGYLRLPIGTKSNRWIALPYLGEPACDLVRNGDRQRHQFLCLIAGITEHHALVPRPTGIDATGDVRRLPIDPNFHSACAAIESKFGIVKAYVADSPSRNLLEVNLRRCGHLAGNISVPKRKQRLGGNSSTRVLFQYGIKSCITDLVCQLIGMPFSD
jgi:hypothetical protein